MDPNELHRLHSDGVYHFSFQTQSGTMEAQPIELAKREDIDVMPAAFPVTLGQGGTIATPGDVDPNTELLVSWEPLVGMRRSPTSELDDLIFVLGFDCFGNNVFHSGRPYQGGPYLTYRDTNTVITPSSLKPGLRYTLVVEQATADVQRFEGVPAIATYASLTFLEFHTSGEPEAQSCPDAK